MQFIPLTIYSMAQVDRLLARCQGICIHELTIVEARQLQIAGASVPSS